MAVFGKLAKEQPMQTRKRKFCCWQCMFARELLLYSRKHMMLRCLNWDSIANRLMQVLISINRMAGKLNGAISYHPDHLHTINY